MTWKFWHRVNPNCSRSVSRRVETDGVTTPAMKLRWKYPVSLDTGQLAPRAVTNTSSGASGACSSFASMFIARGSSVW